MMNRHGVPCSHLVVMTLLMGALALGGGDASSQTMVTRAQRIEIVIQDRTFFLADAVPIQVGQAVEIIVRNKDHVRHGFASASLAGLLVSGEDEQIATYGKGVEGFYVNPDKTLIIRFIAERPGSVPFHCDLHEHEMKGELYVLEVPQA